MKHQLAIFDLDGTILDTLEDLADSLNHALEWAGYPKRTLEEVRSFVGDGMLMLVKRALPENVRNTAGQILPENAGSAAEQMQPENADADAEAERVLAELKAYYKIHCADKTKPYEGILTLLQTLKEAGYKLAVVSNKADYAVQILCEQYFKDIFDLAVGEREGVCKKPAPDAVNAVLDALQIPREQAVYIGDSEVDIMTAENAEMESILVSWGFREAAFLQERGAKKIVATTAELEKALME